MKRIDKALKSITDEEILYFLDNIASRLMVPIQTGILTPFNLDDLTRIG